MTKSLESFYKFQARKTPEMNETGKAYLNALLSLEETFGISEEKLEPTDASLLRPYVNKAYDQNEREKTQARYSNSMSSFYAEPIERWFEHYGIDIKAVLKLAGGALKVEDDPKAKEYILQEWLKAKHEMVSKNPVIETDDN